MELILIRHALPLRVEKNDGTPADPGLSEKGIDQAQRLARWMQAERLDSIYSSPLSRARMTADFLAGTRDMKIAIEPGVQEFDNLSPSYVPMEELRNSNYDEWRDLMLGGFESRFDFASFKKRVVNSLESIVEKNKGKRVAVVCHGGVINIWAARVLGLDRYMFFAPEYTSVNRFLASGAGIRSVLSLNEFAHLHHDIPF